MNQNPNIMKKLLYYALVAATLLLITFPSHLVSAQDCTGFRTSTQKKWGSKPHANSPSVYLHANFTAAFPNGLTIGCGANTLTLTNAQAVTDFLPCGTGSSVLPPGAMIDPGNSYINRFAAHVVTSTLNAGFDSYDVNFGPNPMLLINLTIISGPFAGWKVSQLLAEANNVIGGCSNSSSLHDLNKALVAFNTNFPDTNSNNGYLNCSVCDIHLSATTVNATCYGSNNGSIDVTITGAQGQVAYLWNDGATTEDRTGLGAGTYTVTATDAANCSSTLSETVTQLPWLSITGIVTNVTVTSGSDGSIDVTVPGGIPEYQYLWSDGTTTGDRNGLTAGTYAVTVTDGNGCTAQRSFLVSQPKCSLSIAAIIATNVSCIGCADGTIDVTLTGAQGNVNYLWNNGASTEDLSGLAPGTYVLIATDEGNCSTKLSDSISAPVLKVSETVSDITSVSIFPNPASDQFVIAVETHNNSEARVSVVIENLMGQVVYTIQPQAFNGSLKIPVDISRFTDGSYITRVTIDGKQFFRQLVIHD